MIIAGHSILIEIIPKIRRRMLRLIKSFGSMCIAESFQDIFVTILFPCGVGILDAFSFGGARLEFQFLDGGVRDRHPII